MTGNPWLVAKRKKLLKSAVSAWASKHRDKFVVLGTEVLTSVDEETEVEGIVGIEIEMAPPKGSNGVPNKYPVEMVYLGQEADQWAKRLDKKIPHMLKMLRHRSSLAKQPSRKVNEFLAKE